MERVARTPEQVAQELLDQFGYLSFPALAPRRMGEVIPHVLDPQGRVLIGSPVVVVGPSSLEEHLEQVEFELGYIPRDWYALEYDLFYRVTAE